MSQVWIDIEDNDNCGYFPMQTFEVRGIERVARSIVLDDVTNVDGRCEVVGWSGRWPMRDTRRSGGRFGCWGIDAGPWRQPRDQIAFVQDSGRMVALLWR